MSLLKKNTSQMLIIFENNSFIFGLFQNQIAANQANYVKQQQMGSGSGQDLFKNNLHDPMSALQSNFTDITLNKEPPVI